MKLLARWLIRLFTSPKKHCGTTKTGDLRSTPSRLKSSPVERNVQYSPNLSKPSRQESLTNYGETSLSESKGFAYKPAVEYSGWRLTTISRETCIMLLGLISSYCQYRWYPKPQASDTGNHWWVQCFAPAFYIRWGGGGDLTRRNSYRSRNFHVRLFPMES